METTGPFSYMLHHVFLPPKLPQKDDTNPKHEGALLDAMIESIVTFKSLIAPGEDELTASLLKTLQNLRLVHHEDLAGGVDVEQLTGVVKAVCDEGGMIALPIRAQNAGVLISKANTSHVHFEVFELSPTNEAVMSTSGRLKRAFPASAVALKVELLNQPGLRSVITQTLGDMSSQSVPGTQPQARKAGQSHNEDRDTTHPKVVTELFIAFLKAIGEPVSVPSIGKHTREEVMWHHSLLPWRRSPLWLLVRVTLQLLCRRQAVASSKHDPYKTLMTLFMAHLLDRSSQYSLSADDIHVMKAKVSRRLLKLQAPNEGTFRYVERVLSDTDLLLQRRWTDAQRRLSPEIDMSKLAGLKFAQDVFHPLPKLDDFIRSTTMWRPERRSAKFQAQPVLLDHRSGSLPSVRCASSDGNAIYELHAIETWVDSHLETWLHHHQSKITTTEDVSVLITQYHRAAYSRYLENPEALSVMLLTILELWVACDQATIRQCELLQEYDPGVPVELFQSLLLPSYHEMERLYRAEEYLRLRRRRAMHGSAGVFHDFGTRDCFAVRYFEQSPKHQALMKDIEDHAAETRAEKCRELCAKQEQYRELMSMVDQLECEYTSVVVDWDRGLSESQHKRDCQKCRYQSQAQSLTLKVHEWPLPPTRLDAESTVFELEVPRAFGAWRDVTTYLHVDVLHTEYRTDVRPRSCHPLATYQGLSTFYTPFGSVQRVCLLSQEKPHVGTHRRHKSIAVTTEADVCVHNGLRYRYYDHFGERFIGDFRVTGRMAEQLTFRLPDGSQALQKYLFRPSSTPSGPPSNEVIAGQADCPEHMSLDEYKALTSLSLGYRIQWQNLLVQLAAPSMDFRKEESTLVALQCIYQAGPAGESVRRASHDIVQQEAFSTAFLSCVRDAFGRVKANWESSEALNLFINLTLRVLTLHHGEAVATTALTLLTDLRRTAFDWLMLLRDRSARAVDSVQRSELMHKAVDIALVCVQSFYVDERYLERVLASTSETSILLQCSILIFDGMLDMSMDSRYMTAILQRRWMISTSRSFRYVSASVVAGTNSCLDDTMTQVWPAYIVGGAWQMAPGTEGDWLTKKMGSCETDFVDVHFNVITGQLLVDGVPLSRLPTKYERSAVYRRLFGPRTVDVIPSSMPGMHFSTRTEYSGHVVYFGFGSVGGNDSHYEPDLRVQSLKSGTRRIHVPHQLLADDFPAQFSTDYVHWYDAEAGEVEFCPTDQAWTTSTSNWRLAKSPGDSGWRLNGGATSLVSIRSATARAVSHVLAPLEDLSQIHVIFQPPSASIRIEVPRLQLEFHLASGQSAICSKQFRGMTVDPSQRIGTLIGLQNRLVLRGDRGQDRLLIIPEASVFCKGEYGHVSVGIHRDQSTRFHTFFLDDMLGRLLDNGSVRSKLYLAYLHALTSFCIPDPLTHKTGSEQALSILRSAHVRSCDQLDQDEIKLLEEIAALTPGRQYYPVHERVMQTIEWRSDIGYLAQHGMFAMVVQSISDSLDRAKPFSPHSVVLVSGLQHVDRNLLHRDNIRSSTLRIDGFGAEQFTTDHDHDYTSRDQGHESADASRAFQIASFVYRDQPNLCFSLPACTHAWLWEHFLPAREICGPAHTFSQYELQFNAEWLREPFQIVAGHWTSFHRRLTDDDSRANKFALAMWFSTLAFTTLVDISLILTLAAFVVVPEMRGIQVPSADRFKLHLGKDMNAQDLRAVVQTSLKSFAECPESQGPGAKNQPRAKNARHHEFQRNQNQAVKTFVDSLVSQWPCRTPRPPTDLDQITASIYVNVKRAMKKIRPLYEAVFENRCFFVYLNDVQQALSRLLICPAPLTRASPDNPVWEFTRIPRYVPVDSIFAGPDPLTLPYPTVTLDQLGLLFNDKSTNDESANDVTSLPALLDVIEPRARSTFETKYIQDLRDSSRHLSSIRSHRSTLQNDRNVDVVLSRYHKQCEESVEQSFVSIRRVLHSNDTFLPGSSVTIRPVLLKHFARVSPTFLLEQLSRVRWTRLPSGWREAIVHYALGLTRLQQADRLLRYADQRSKLLKELQNSGHNNWNPSSQPETLLLEVESGIMIREIQLRIAQEMGDPRAGRNTTMQLNMGEGKSSVIMPITAASLADTSRLVRVVVAKPLAKQMFHTLTSKLGGLLNRRVYRMPFSRDLPLDEPVLRDIHRICEECMEEGGVLLVQPEHMLSLKLMGLECLISGKMNMARSVTRLLSFFDNFARDLVDESDEIFNVKFELVYSMGTQQPLELSPERWICLQHVLEFVRLAAVQIQEECPAAVEVRQGQPGSFPRIHILQTDAQKRLNRLVAERVCETGFHGFAIAQQPEDVRLAVRTYISEMDLSADDIVRVEHERPGSFWAGSTKDLLLLLRGLLAGEIVTFALSHKRWRVNYGRDVSRQPVKRLAVPYRAKDSPSLRSEFSHPDVVMTLTSLCYYYGGLNDDDLFTTFAHLLRSDQADVEYQIWVQQAAGLPLSFHQLSGINLKDMQQCTTQVFPPFRLAKAVVDYFLSQIVFSKEMREFPQKLTASGWDIGEIKHHPTTGFSGTVDLSPTLPLTVTFERLPEQRHTNALVLERLLRPENSVVVLSPGRDPTKTDFDVLLDTFQDMPRAPRVILDVGAQILDHDNLGVAQNWLDVGHEKDAQAVVFFNDDDDLCVLDRDGRIEALQISPFARHLDVCLVYLDEAHTRGTDLQLPDHYSAAVTLGPHVTKDRLVQACMRMRKLGQGQAVVFCVSQRIRSQILECTGKCAEANIDVADVLGWAVSETFADLRRSMSLWAAQGRRFERHDPLWNGSSEQGKRNIVPAQAKKFLEDESLSLEHRYRPHAEDSEGCGAASAVSVPRNAIDRRCEEFQILPRATANLHEEQERELAPEVEQERYVERPAPAAPADHHVHPDLISFVNTGRLSPSSSACTPAFQTLADTSAALHFDLSRFPSDLWVTCDFSRTIRGRGPNSRLDSYQRSVQWILVGSDGNVVDDETAPVLRVIVISPHEAQHLLPPITTSRKVSLHLYAARPNLGLRPLDHLNLYTIPSRRDRDIPQRAIMLLNLFAGQLYFDDYEEYVRMCEFLGVIWRPARSDDVIAADGFVQVRNVASPGQGVFVKSPIQCIRVLQGKIRKNGESIDKTHMGRLLGAVLLHPRDFSRSRCPLAP